MKLVICDTYAQYELWDRVHHPEGMAKYIMEVRDLWGHRYPDVAVITGTQRRTRERVEFAHHAGLAIEYYPT